MNTTPMTTPAETFSRLHSDAEFDAAINAARQAAYIQAEADQAAWEDNWYGMMMAIGNTDFEPLTLDQQLAVAEICTEELAAELVMLLINEYLFDTYRWSISDYHWTLDEFEYYCVRQHGREIYSFPASSLAAVLTDDEIEQLRSITCLSDKLAISQIVHCALMAAGWRYQQIEAGGNPYTRFRFGTAGTYRFRFLGTEPLYNTQFGHLSAAWRGPQC